MFDESVADKSRAWLAWVSAALFVIYYFSILTGYSIVNPSIQKDLAITPTQVGVIAATYTWMYAVGQLFSGVLLDRFGARRVLLPAILCVACGCFVFANSSGFNMLVLSQIVLALGACAGFVGAGYVGGEWFGPARFSYMFGLVQFSSSVSSAFSQNAITLALDLVSWRELFTYAGIGGVFLFFFARRFLRDPSPKSLTEGIVPVALLKDIGSSILHVARIPHIWVLAISGGLVFGSMLSMGVVWAPKLLADQGMQESHITMSASLIWLGLALGCLSLPCWSDIIKRRKTPMICATAVQLMALSGIVFLPTAVPWLKMCLCFAFGLGSAAHMLSFSSAADVVNPARIGSASAFVNGTMFLVGGVLISRPGVRIDKALSIGITSGIELAEYAAAPLIASLILALIFLFFMKETYPSSTGK